MIIKKWLAIYKKVFMAEDLHLKQSPLRGALTWEEKKYFREYFDTNTFTIFMSKLKTARGLMFFLVRI